MRRALVIGNNYVGTHAALQGCFADADDRAALAEQRRFVPTVYRDADEATITGALIEHVRQTKGGDSLLVYYSGHGTNLLDDDGDEADGYDEAIVAADLVAIRDDFIRGILANLPPRANCTLELDSCNSGGASRFYGSQAPRTGRAKYLRPVEVKRAVGRERMPGTRPTPRAEPPIRWAQFSGCEPDKVSLESLHGGVTRGDFTVALTAVYRESGPGITHAGVLSRVRTKMGPNRQQNPTLDVAPGFERRTLVTVPRA